MGMDPLRIAFVAAEAAPFAKAGGLADVASALSRHLWRAGHDVRLFLPRYAQIEFGTEPVHTVDLARDVAIDMGGTEHRFTLRTSPLPGTTYWVYFVDCPSLYDRGGIYVDAPDEHVRFAFLCRAVIECCQRMKWAPQVIHLNDWHTGLMPLYLRTLYAWDALFRGVRTVFTIHNIAYQGNFDGSAVSEVGLAGNEHLLHPADRLEGRVNFLRTAIHTADAITTVSPTHAREILSSEYGAGMDGVLREREDGVIGIVNGADYEVWNPATDPYLPHRYDVDDLEGKAANRAALLEETGLRPDPPGPVFGVISRLVSQKGFDLFTDALPDVLDGHDVRLVTLGTGEPDHEEFFRGLEWAYPGKAAFRNGYDEALAHRIEAGSDVFVMPSRYEPCGLNQIYSQRYGTVPLVRRTGGLADTVDAWDPDTGRGNGFVFEDYTPEALQDALERAVAAFRDRDAWSRLVRNGMRRDLSWRVRAGEYEALYRRLLP